MFEDRNDAAENLALALSDYRGSNPLGLAIPRGAVPIGKVLAQRLGGELDVVLVRKLGAPDDPELAIGAVDETGWTHIAEHAAAHGADAAYIEARKQEQLALMRRRRALYSATRAAVDPAGRIVILVDDGLATGATMLTALHALRVRGPLKLICAVPVAPAATVAKIEPHADRVVCLLTPPGFYAVGQFYVKFPQVEDDEVIALLNQAPAPALG